MKTIAFFNNKGGVGKTSLVYHLAWMYAELGLSVVAADLDPQSNLTSMFLPEDRLEEFWQGDEEAPSPKTVYGAVHPQLVGTGDIKAPHIEEIEDNLGLLLGDIALSTFEDELSRQWPDCLDRKERAFRVLSALWRVLDFASRARHDALVLIDVGPNLGAINRAALVATDHVVVPLAPDLFSIQGLKNLGPTLRRWREGWGERRPKNPAPSLRLPEGTMTPAGYIILQHVVRLDRPVQAYDRWMRRIPSVYREAVLKENAGREVSIQKDPHCLAMLKHYRSLMPLAQEARKPMFYLKPADGALGGHSQAVHDCHRDFADLAKSIARHCGVALP